MVKKTKARLTELQKEVKAKLEQSTISNFDEASKFQPVTNAIAGLSVTGYVGTISSVGETSTSEYQVSFVSNNLTYVSFWPQWAYELAKTSLLSGKGVALVANGDAFGANLLGVWLIS
jgi:hypothetical protein